MLKVLPSYLPAKILGQNFGTMPKLSVKYDHGTQMNIPIVSQQHSISHSYALSKKLRSKEVFQRVDLYLDGVQDSFSPLVHDHHQRDTIDSGEL